MNVEYVAAKRTAYCDCGLGYDEGYRSPDNAGALRLIEKPVVFQATCDLWDRLSVNTSEDILREPTFVTCE